MDSAQRGRGPFVWRFLAWHRLAHALAIGTFYTLVLTGLPLRYACAPYSAGLISLFGGVESAGRIHRIAGGVMIVYTLIYVAYLLVRLMRAKEKRRAWLWGSDSLIPHPQDAIDFLKQWKYFFTGRDRPQFGRYGYLEKLDFFGEVWGFIIIGGSGMLLWFPEFFGSFLPGWWFNVATVFHGVEALLATCFIFVVHFFNVHLRPDKWPMDAVMFHGRATVHYMEEEHPGVMPQIEANLDKPVSRKPVVDHPAPAPGRTESFVAATLGFILLAVGVAIIGMILWAVTFC
jgi:cytochrome b subunit of formate dehydrogenase